MKDLIKKILKEEQDLEWAQDVVKGEPRPTRSLVIKRQTDNPKNAIELYTEVMHGDGDSYDKNKILFYKNGKGVVNGQANFDDFEKAIEFLKNGNLSDIGDENEDYFLELGCIDYDEYADYGFEIATVEEVFYYDDMGNKYDAHIDGLSPVPHEEVVAMFRNEFEEDGDNNEEDEEVEEDYECQMCGDDDDTGEGICSDCLLDMADEDASYTH